MAYCIITSCKIEKSSSILKIRLKNSSVRIQIQVEIEYEIETRQTVLKCVNIFNNLWTNRVAKEKSRREN